MEGTRESSGGKAGGLVRQHRAQQIIPGTGTGVIDENDGQVDDHVGVSSGGMDYRHVLR